MEEARCLTGGGTDDESVDDELDANVIDELAANADEGWRKGLGGPMGKTCLERLAFILPLISSCKTDEEAPFA